MPRTINEGFEIFISRLKPLNSEHKKVQKHKKSVSSCLKNNFNRRSFFETGSFGLGTGVKHFSDTDYFVSIPIQNLTGDSRYFLQKLRDALKRTFPTTKGIGVSSPAVKIPFGKYMSETMEITPCSFHGLVQTPLGKVKRYKIPNCKGGWMYSSPQAHNAYINKHNKRLKKDRAKHLIQLVKAWKYYQNVPLSSFYLELRVIKYLENKKTINYDITLARIFNYLLKCNLANIKDPMGISGQTSACRTLKQKEKALSKLKTASSRANKAIEAKRKGKIDKTFHWWGLVFNKQFPAR